MTGDCETCGLPIVWSIDQARPWCAVYGDHPTPSVGANVVLRAHTIADVIQLDLAADRAKYSRRMA